VIEAVKLLVNKESKKFGATRQMTYICATKVGYMKKKGKDTSYKQNTSVSKSEEPMVSYRSVKAIPPVKVKDFNYAEFKKIADKAPFTQSEWASILHISERTLQRYAKNNGSFAAINAERALQIENVLKEGTFTFSKVENFYNWLKRKPYMLGGNLSIESLTSASGIERVLTQLHRIQHGLFA